MSHSEPLVIIAEASDAAAAVPYWQSKGRRVVTAIIDSDAARKSAPESLNLKHRRPNENTIFEIMAVTTHLLPGQSITKRTKQSQMLYVG